MGFRITSIESYIKMKRLGFTQPRINMCYVRDATSVLVGLISEISFAQRTLGMLPKARTPGLVEDLQAVV
jgi:hypothetical protein